MTELVKQHNNNNSSSAHRVGSVLGFLREGVRKGQLSG